MIQDVIIDNDPAYLLLQWLGMDYNFWTMILANIILIVGFFGVLFLLGFIYMVIMDD